MVKRYKVVQRFKQCGKDRTYEKMEIVESEKGAFVRIEDYQELEKKLNKAERMIGILKVSDYSVTGPLE